MALESDRISSPPTQRLSLERGLLLAGKYELVELAGTGGMAEVFRGIAHGAAGFRRTVAIKRVLEQFSQNPEFVSMFVEEARVGSDLMHPNIVQIHDFDLDGTGRYFLVMEWVEGVNLAEYRHVFQTQKRATPWPLVAAAGIEVLKALSAAHERTDAHGRPAPVYHRDVTPSNILLGRNGIVKLTDFGLARAMDRARMTQPHILKGKLSYVAPEMVEGKDPSPMSDVFSIGVVLWETLSGEKLFRGDTPVDVLRAVRAADIPPLEARRTDLPLDLPQVVHRALAKNPEDRFSSARSMARALANILRLTPHPTGADVIGKAVAETIRTLDGRKLVDPNV